MADENKDADVLAPRLKLGQSSVSGLNVMSGVIYEEQEYALRWPQAIITYKEMKKDATIAPALNLVEMAIARVPWVVKVPKGSEESLMEKKVFLEQVMNDMDVPWTTFIQQAASHNTFGFYVGEKVYRARTIASGSKYDDGKIGLRKIAPIPQETVTAWNFESKGRSLDGLYQQPTYMSNRDQAPQVTTNEPIWIPRKKFLLMRNNPLKDNPEGESPLKSCYTAWRYKVALEKNESIGVSADLRGMKVLYLPPQYLAEDADPEMKAVRDYYERGMSLLHNNEQSSLILPMIRDDKGQEMFKFELMSIMGQKAHDTRKIITDYKKEIITSLMASQLILGQDGGGSYSLAESQSSVSRMVVDARLTEIRDQLNHDLIPQLFRLNKWDVTNTPYFDFGEIAEESLDEISKYVQRTAAVGLMPKTAETVNWITNRLGMPPQLDDSETTEDIAPMLTGYTSGAGEGMSSPSGNGTAKSASTNDNSVANLEN